MPWLLRTSGIRVALLAVVLALGFLGSRGIWDPDEGRYTNVALTMLDSGDWINPRRSPDVGHWTKPPLTYWGIASSVAVFGHTPWAARLPAALCYLLSVWLAWRIARRLAPGAEPQAAVIYATMLLPFGAAQWVNTDYVLAAAEGVAVWAFVEARFGVPSRSRRWLLVMWAGFALAFMAKGPPGLLPLPVLLAFNALMPRHERLRTLHWSGLLLFAALALPWFVAVTLGHPGLLQHLVDKEVVGRIASDRFARHGAWYGWIQIYLPTLLLGCVPWTAELWRWIRALPASARRWWSDPRTRVTEAAPLLLALWVCLPLLVLCLSRSRLPLYLLPLFLPLAVAFAAQRTRAGRRLPRWPWLLGWAGILLALKFGASLWPTHKDAGEWADEIRARVDGPVAEVIFVEDMARHGLHLHLGAAVEKISLQPEPRARFHPVNDSDLDQELARHKAGVVWICKQALWPALRERIAREHFRATALGSPYRGRVIFRVDALPPHTARP